MGRVTIRNPRKSEKKLTLHSPTKAREFLLMRYPSILVHAHPDDFQFFSAALVMTSSNISSLKHSVNLSRVDHLLYVQLLLKNLLHTPRSLVVGKSSTIMNLS